MAAEEKEKKLFLRSKIKGKNKVLSVFIQPVFRIRDMLRRRRIPGSVHWITDPALFSSMVFKDANKT
jgi:hypothetical protein